MYWVSSALKWLFVSSAVVNSVLLPGQKLMGKERHNPLLFPGCYFVPSGTQLILSWATKTSEPRLLSLSCQCIKTALFDSLAWEFTEQPLLTCYFLAIDLKNMTRFVSKWSSIKSEPKTEYNRIALRSVLRIVMVMSNFSFSNIY